MDTLYSFVTAATALVAVLVVIVVTVFAARDRGRSGDRIGGVSLAGSTPLDVVWSIIPFVVAIGVFGWATMVFVHRVRLPDATRPIYAAGKPSAASGRSVVVERKNHE